MNPREAYTRWYRIGNAPVLLPLVIGGCIAAPFLGIIWTLAIFPGIAILRGLIPRMERQRSEELSFEWRAILFDFRWLPFCLLPIPVAALNCIAWSSLFGVLGLLVTGLLLTLVFLFAVAVYMVFGLFGLRKALLRFQGKVLRFLLFTGFDETSMDARPSATGEGVVFEVAGEPVIHSFAVDLASPPVRGKRVGNKEDMYFAWMIGRCPMVRGIERRKSVYARNPAAGH